MHNSVRKLLVVFWIAATVRLESFLVLREEFGELFVGFSGIDQIQHNLVKDLQEDHEEVHKAKTANPVRVSEKTSIGDTG